MPADSALPGRTELEKSCYAYGLNAAGAQLLHRRSNAVWRVDDVVIRLAPDTPLRRTRADTSIAVTRWLASTATAPVALHPLPGDQPVLIDGAVATFWPYRPTSAEPTAGDVGKLVRLLHKQPSPPFPIPEYRPLRRLREALEVDAARRQPVLSRQDRDWLHNQADHLIAAFEATRFPLGHGLVHADAHAENTVLDNGSWVLIDWDNACYGPRELDLVGTLPDHFYTPHTDRAELVRAYGYDLLDWPGWMLLRDITEYHSLGSYLRLAADTPRAASELHRRVESLRTGDRDVVWQAIS
ncbi:aminoglycoside phosphotransferase family protein [Nocardia cyriacigeorgica]|uniref:Aminoglycoside phosphotransferase family protein n=1 Tax=Nocardia cyriacigeorgica TaxID=135487 RepID=A0A5R8P584_9NOCA|nr:aminoglycoside phosphotransferase family protein [Nocardia cyriacigeorgica]TLF92953.1 aminoglycoside phosphotransferase family protein [Nocardia cyriacigeorgica]